MYRPEKFKCDLNESTTSQHENEMEMSDDDDDGLPPLEANTNRMRPFELHSDENLESNSDTDDWLYGYLSSCVDSDEYLCLNSINSRKKLSLY